MPRRVNAFACVQTLSFEDSFDVQRGCQSADVTAAIFGLIGVIVGGVLNAVVTTVLEGHRNRKGLQAAARLLLFDVATAQTIYKQCLDEDTWKVLPIRPISLDQWDEWKVTLATSIPDSVEWRKILTPFLDAQHFNDLASRHEERDPLSQPSREGMTGALARTEEAIPVLAPYVRGEHLLSNRLAKLVGRSQDVPVLEDK